MKKNHDPVIFGINITVRVFQSMMMMIFVLIMMITSFAVGCSCGYFASLAEDGKILSKKELRQEINDLSEVSTINFANGNLISGIKSDLVRVRVAAKDIPKVVKDAVISIEDENFYQHRGFVPKAVIRAILSEAMNSKNSSGGSTITQQLAKQQVLDSEMTFKRKVNEILLAHQIEKNFSKEDILTSYLNVSPFGKNNKGENIAGVETAALGIFGKKAKELSIPQAAFIAGLPQSPCLYSPYDAQGHLKSASNLQFGLKRQKQVLYNMYREHCLSKEEYQKAKNYDLTQDFIKPAAHEQEQCGSLYYTTFRAAVDCLACELAKCDHCLESDLWDKKTYRKYCDKAKYQLRNKGLKVTTTIDQDIYNAMQESVAQYGYCLDDCPHRTVETGNVLLDNATGAILGFVGGRNFQTNQNNHAFDTWRSPGSSIKPLLVYGPALNLGVIGSESLLSNFPTKYKSNGQDIMHVDSKGTDEFMTVRRSVAESWNIPAYHLYQKLREDKHSPENYMKKMNFVIDDYTIESLPLGGGVETTVLQQTNGYQTLANGGIYQQEYLISSIVDANGRVLYQHRNHPVKVFSKPAAAIMNNILRDVINSGKTTEFKKTLEAINPNLAKADWIGKTGTSDNYVDAWLTVATPKVTLGAWSGNDDNASLNPYSSVINNARYLAYLVNALHNTNPELFGVNQKFELDPKVIKAEVSKFTGQKPKKIKVFEQEVDLLAGEKGETLFAKDGPKDSDYKFGIGGSDDNYKAAWEKFTKKEPPKDKK